MSSPWDTFEGIYVLNLDRRLDKWQAMQKHLAGQSWFPRVERVQGVDMPHPPHPRWLGSFWGHLRCLEKIVENNNARGMIFEDDIGVDEHADEILAKTLKQVPEWDALFLGFCHSPRWADKIVKHTANAWRIYFCAHTHAYALTKDAAKKVLDEGREYLNGLPEGESPRAFDKWLADHFATALKAYGCNPQIVCQEHRGFMSDNAPIRTSHHRKQVNLP